MINLTLSLILSTVGGQSLYKCSGSNPDCTDIVSLETTTDCSRDTIGEPFSQDSSTRYISINSGVPFDSVSMTQTSWTCPPQQTIAGESYESDEMKLCGFQASTGSATGDAFDGFKAIFCHKYSWSTQTTKTIFDDAKGGNSPGEVNVQLDYSGNYQITVSGGTDNGKKLVKGPGANGLVELTQLSYTGNKIWDVQLLENGKYSIKLMGETNSKEYLTAGISTDRLTLEQWLDDDTQKWELRPTANKMFHIITSAVMPSGKTYLSTWPDGGMDFWTTDDNSGRQKWKFEPENVKILYNGQGDCEYDHMYSCYTGLSCCLRYGGGWFCPGLQGTAGGDHTDFCGCPNWPICPYGHADGDRVSSFSNPWVMCDSGQFIDSIQFDTTSFTSIKFRCSDVATSSNAQVASRSGFKTVGVWDSSNSPDVYTSHDSHFCGIRAIYGALSSTDPTITFTGLLSLDLILCQSYNCQDSLALTSNALEDRVYKVVPGNTDFEKPAIETISQQSVTYDQTWDNSNNPLNKISHYLTNLDNLNCPIETCELMENCNVNPSKKETDTTLIWQPTDSEIETLASQSTNDWASQAANIHIYHVNTDPTSLFKFTNLCIRCKNQDRYGNTDKTIQTRAFTVEIHCKEGIFGSMADETTGTKSESSLINSVVQTQHVSADQTLRPKFNFTSFYTTTKACPIDFYQISDDFYIEGATNLVAQSYYKFPAGIVPKSFTDSDELPYSSQSGPIDIDEHPSPTMSGTVSSNSFFIEVLDGKVPFTYTFRIKAWVLGGYFSPNPSLLQDYNEGQSSYVTQFLTLRAICPTFQGNVDELEPTMLSLPDHTTWVAAPASQSTYSLNQPFRPKLPKCMEIIEYSAVDESASGVLSYPSSSSSCMTIPCMSWDISTTVVYPVHSPFTFKVQVKSNLGFTYTSNQISIKVLADNSAQPQIQTGLVPQQGQTYILKVGGSEPFEIDKFTEIIYGNDISNYILTTDTTELSQNLNSPGCGGFLDSNIQGVAQSNGKIEFTINTAFVAPACPVKVYAEVKQQTQIFAFTGVFSISVECGSETISLHPSIQSILSPDELVHTLELTTAQKLFSITSHSSSLKVTGTPIFISSLPGQCDIDHNKYSRVDASDCSPSAGSQVTLDGTDLKFDADSTFQEIICIKAETAKVTNSPTLYRLEITVCGLQTLSPASILESQRSHLINKGEPKVINFSNSWFDKVYSSPKPSCVQTLTYELKVGSSCQGIANPSDFVLDTSALTINLTAQSSMQPQILCLIASALGQQATQLKATQQQATQKLTVEVCGDEQISYHKFSNFSELHTFERSNDTSNNVKQMNLASLSMSFSSSRVNCPISYRLVGTHSGPQTSLTINSSTGDFSLNTSDPYEFEGFIQAYSHNDRAPLDSDKIRIHVCGFESIDESVIKFHNQSDPYVEKFAIGKGLKTARINLDLFRDSLNNTKCPFKSFALVKFANEYSKQLEEPFIQDFSWKEDTIYVNTDLDRKVYEKYGIKQDKEKVVTFQFYIEGTTAGFVKQRKRIEVKIADTFVQFNTRGFQFFIQVCRDESQNQCASKWKQIKLFEPVIDPSAPKEYFDMLTEVSLPSTSFDQPSGESTDDPEGICFVHVVVSKTKATENIAKFIQKNPGQYLPLQDVHKAFMLYVSYNIAGTSTDNVECFQKVESAADQGYTGEILAEKFKDHDQDQIVEELNRDIKTWVGQRNENYQAQVSEALKKKEDEKTVKRMRIESIKIFYNEKNIMFLDVNFDMQILPLSDFQVNLLPNVLILNVQSAIDQSEFKGMWVSNQQGRFLNQTGTTDGSKEALKYKESKQFVSQSFESLQFYWRLHNQEEQRLRFKIDFQYPYNVSRNNFGQDTVKLAIIENEVLRDFENKNPLDLSQYGQEITANLNPMKAEPKVEQQIKSSVDAFSFAVLALQSGSVFVNLFLSKGLKKVWAIIFTQSIVIHMNLFRCQITAAPIIFTFNQYLSNSVKQRLIQYKAVLGAIFDFEEEESPVEQFELLGYEGVIFISLAGSIIINLLIPSGIYLQSQVFKRLAMRFPDVKVFRSIAVYLGAPDFILTIQGLYLASFLELVFCCVISITFQNNGGFQKGKASNLFSAIIMVISIKIMLLIMFANVYLARKYRDKQQNPIIKEKYGFIFEGYKTDKFATAIFQVVFMIRRIIFAMIIILLKDQSGLQVISNVALTFVYIAYLAHYKPCEELGQNKNEIFNDCCTMLVSYFLMWLSIFPDYTEEEKDTVNNISWLYVCTASFNVVVNLLKLSYQISNDLPKKWKQAKAKYQDWKYESWKKGFLKKQIQNLKAQPNSQLQKHFAREAQKIQMREEYEAEFQELKEKHQREAKWALKSNFDDQRYQKFIQECQRTELHELQKKYFGITKKELAQMNMINVKLEICDMIPISMPHNDRYHIFKENLFPYKEHVYLNKQQEALKDGKQPSEEEARNFNRKIFILRQLHLLKFLQYQQYYRVRIKKDGNSDFRAISALQFGNQKHWRRVRRQMCEKMEQDLTKKYKGKKHKMSFKQELKKIEHMKQGTEGSNQFSDIELLQVCSDLYNMTIVVFSLFSRMRFMDILIQPTSKSCQPSVPRYLLHHDNHFTVLVHRSQPNLRKFYRQKSSRVRLFKQKDFMVGKEDLIASLKQNVLYSIKSEQVPKEEKSEEMSESDKSEKSDESDKNTNKENKYKQANRESQLSQEEEEEEFKEGDSIFPVQGKKSLSRYGINQKLTKQALIKNVKRISEHFEEDIPSSPNNIQKRGNLSKGKLIKHHLPRIEETEIEEFKEGDSMLPEFEEGDLIFSVNMQSKRYQTSQKIDTEQ